VLETEVYVLALRRITLVALAAHLRRQVDGVQAGGKAPLKKLNALINFRSYHRMRDWEALS
jgi:hypothetical protein